MENQSDTAIAESEIEQLFQADQADREMYAKDPSKSLEISQRDEQRLEKARKILKVREIPEPQSLNKLAFIFQHGDTVEDYETALKLTTKAVDAGLPPEYSLIPQATDRLIIKKQLNNGIPMEQVKQKYGTQVLFDKTGNPFTPPSDHIVTEEEFKKFGLNKGRF